MSSTISAATAAATPSLPDPDDNYVSQLWTLCILFPVLATIAVALRFVSRKLKAVGLWWDDWIALLALLLVWVDFVFVVQSIFYGKGRHITLLSTYDRMMISYWSYWFSMFYTAIPAAIKMSALLLYKRIFVSTGFSRIVKVVMVVVTCWGFVSVFISAFGCSPISSFWTGKGKCINEHAWVLGFGIPNIVLDVVVWALPIPRVWTLNLPRSQKIILSGIFLMGLTDCALAIVRLAGSAESLGDSDTSYSWAPAMWWCLIHTCLGIVVISLPTMRILVTNATHALTSQRFRVTEASTTHSGSIAIKQRKAKHQPLDDMEIALSGEDDIAMHSNTIARALRRDSENGSVPESGIRVQNEFTLADEDASEFFGRQKSISMAPSN